jgi:hypothetical protein
MIQIVTDAIGCEQLRSRRLCSASKYDVSERADKATVSAQIESIDVFMKWCVMRFEVLREEPPGPELELDQHLGFGVGAVKGEKGSDFLAIALLQDLFSE